MKEKRPSNFFQVMGRLIKDYFAEKASIPSESIFHVSIEPCVERRTESQRVQFKNQEDNSADVDLVFTTQELKDVLKSRNIDIFDKNLSLNHFKENLAYFGELVRDPGSFSKEKK